MTDLVPLVDILWFCFSAFLTTVSVGLGVVLVFVVGDWISGTGRYAKTKPAKRGGKAA